MSDALPDFVREEKLPDFVREEHPAPAHAAMGGNETLLHRFLQKFVPGSGEVVDQALAQGRADESAGFRPSAMINRGRTDVPAAGVTPTSAQAGASAAQVPEKLAEVKAAAAQGGVDNPIRAGLGNAMGSAAGLMAIPGIGKALGTIGPATEALSPAIGKFGAYILTRALAGMGIGAGAAAYKGQNPESGVLPGALMTVSPGLAGTYRAVSALAPGISGEERATRFFEGAPLAAVGASSTAAEMAPQAQNQANASAARAIYGQQLSKIRQAGGYEGALSNSAHALKEGVVKFGNTAADIGENAVGARDRVGSEIAGDLDANEPGGILKQAMTPEAMRQYVLSELRSKYEPLSGSRPLLPRAESIANDIYDAAQAKGGGDPLKFGQMNEQKSSLYDQGYPAGPNSDHSTAQVYRDAGGAVNALMKQLGAEQAKTQGPEAFAKWQKNNERYGALAEVADAGEGARNKALANRGISLSDYQVGTGGGVTPRSIVEGFLNKQLRQRGNASTAAALNGLAKLGGKAPNVFDSGPPAPAPPPIPTPPAPALEPSSAMQTVPRYPGEGAPPRVTVSRPPSVTVLPQAPKGPIVPPSPPPTSLPGGPGMALPRGPLVNPPSTPPAARLALPQGPMTEAGREFAGSYAPQYDSNPTVNRAGRLEFESLLNALENGKQSQDADIMNPSTGKVLLPAKVPNESWMLDPAQMEQHIRANAGPIKTQQEATNAAISRAPAYTAPALGKTGPGLEPIDPRVRDAFWSDNWKALVDENPNRLEKGPAKLAEISPQTATWRSPRRPRKTE